CSTVYSQPPPNLALRRRHRATVDAAGAHERRPMLTYPSMPPLPSPPAMDQETLGARRREPKRCALYGHGRQAAALAAGLLPPAARDAALRERGAQIVYARYAPLRPAP